MGQIENNICDAINILVDKAISNIKLDKTILGTIEECIDEGAQKYRVKYQDSSFNAYSTGNQKYRKKSQVYVLIPANDNTQNRIILGSVDKLGDGYIIAVSAENKMTKIGCNMFNHNTTDELCSYKTEQIIYDRSNSFGIKIDDLQSEYYQNESKYFIIAADFQTTMPESQRYGQGDYGIIITCKYFNKNSQQDYEKDYILHVPNMIGQPYQFSTPNRQYGIFQLEDQLIDITKITLFSKDFPEQIITVEELPVIEEVIPNKCYYRIADNTYWIYQQNQWTETTEPGNDIFISNYEFYYLQALTDDEIAGAALKIETTKYGAVFKETIPKILLKARLKLSGSIVYDTDKIEYYWFVRDLSITNESQDYDKHGGTGWRCLNPRLNTSQSNNTNIEEDENSNQFIADTNEKEILITDCPSSSLRFKCVAIVNGYSLKDEIVIYNEVANYQITLNSKYGNSFPFDNYRSIITATVKDKQRNPVTDCFFIWGYETDEGGFYIIPNVHDAMLQHYPIGNSIKYIVSVRKNNINIGNAEILLTNQQQQEDFTLNLINGNQVFKYTTLGYSPTYQGNKDQNKQIIQALDFELYDRYGNLIGMVKDQNGNVIKDDRVLQNPLDEGHHLLDCAWYLPVENTMLSTDRPDSPSIAYYNGIKYYKYNVNNQNQLSFNFKIRDQYDKRYTNNDIILEVKYKDHTCTTSTNFTFTKDGEVGTNGTEYIARIVPESNIEQVYIRINNNNSREIKGWKYDESSIQFNTYSGNFYLEIWNGDSQPVGKYHGNNHDSNWNIIPNLKNISAIIECNTETKNEQTYNIGKIKTNLNPFDEDNYRAILLQASRSDKSLSKFASAFYDEYAIPVMKISNPNTEYIITGGFNDVQYSSNGKVSNYSKIPFKIIKYIKNIEGKYIKTDFAETDNIVWKTSWNNQTYTGVTPQTIEGKVPTPPQTLEGTANNYILIIINNTDIIIWSENFYFDRYSMDLVNGWDGHAVAIGENYMLTPQIGAGVKENNNTLTGIVIGKTYDTNTNTNRDIGLFGYNYGYRTIFLDAQKGTATFGIDATDWGCLKLTPGTIKIDSTGKLLPPNDDAILIKSGNFTRAKYDNKGQSTQTITTPGKGVEFELSTKNPHIYFGNGVFELDKDGNVFLQGNIRATQGCIGGWTIDNGSLVGTKNSNTIKLDLDGDYAPSIQGNNDSWYIRGNGTFMLANNKIKYTNNKLTIQGNLQGTNRNWYIDENGNFKFGKNSTYIKFDQNESNPKVTIRANLQGSTRDTWHIDETGDFKLASGALGYNMDDAHPGFYFEASQGKITLGPKMVISLNNIPIQGIFRTVTANPDTGIVSTFESYCIEMPFFVILYIFFTTGDKIASGSPICLNLPKPRVDTYVSIQNPFKKSDYAAVIWKSSGNLVIQEDIPKNTSWNLLSIVYAK